MIASDPLLSFTQSPVMGAASRKKKGGSPEDARRSSVMSNIANIEALYQPPSPSEWLNEAIEGAQGKVRTYTIEKAAELFAKGYGDEDVAVAVYGRLDGFTLAAARGLRLEVQSRAGGR